MIAPVTSRLPFDREEGNQAAMHGAEEDLVRRVRLREVLFVVAEPEPVGGRGGRA